MLVKLVAKRRVRVGRIEYDPGDTFLVNEKEARGHILVGHAVLAPMPKRPRHIETQPVVEKQVEPEPRPNFEAGHYLRRDMQAMGGRPGLGDWQSSSQADQVPEPASTDSVLPKKRGRPPGSLSRKT
jgi:hypothetical protein